MDFLFSFKSGLIALLGLLVAFIGKTYLLPLLRIEKNRRYAIWIAHLADEITDDLIRRYPDNRWLEFIDDAVDKLISICGIEREIALRAVNSALARKSA